MKSYLISSPHGVNECMRAIDETQAKGTRILDRFYFGCKDGDHTGYAIIEAKSLSDALGMVPDFIQEKACVTPVDKFTAADIKAMHTKAA